MPVHVLWQLLMEQVRMLSWIEPKYTLLYLLFQTLILGVGAIERVTQCGNHSQRKNSASITSNQYFHLNAFTIISSWKIIIKVQKIWMRVQENHYIYNWHSLEGKCLVAICNFYVWTGLTTENADRVCASPTATPTLSVGPFLLLG